MTLKSVIVKASMYHSFPNATNSRVSFMYRVLSVGGLATGNRGSAPELTELTFPVETTPSVSVSGQALLSSG